jgi:OOP family OmpA-OmpF porin
MQNPVVDRVGLRLSEADRHWIIRRFAPKRRCHRKKVPMLPHWTHLAAASVVALSAMWGLGCSAAQPEQRPPVLPIHDARLDNGAYRVSWPTLGQANPMYIHLAVGPDLGEACEMPAPHFFFDATAPVPQDADALDSLARCLNRPDSKDMKIQLIGHADPRGSAEYNMKLAKARAQMVAGILEAHGVAPQRISIASMGAKDAVGNLPQYSFGYDRRVDIDLLAEHEPEGPRALPAQRAAPSDVAVRQPELPSVQGRGEDLQMPPVVASNRSTRTSRGAAARAPY